MKKRNLPIGNARKRWIDRLPDEIYYKLSPKDFENYKLFQKYSRLRETKIQTINKLKARIKNLKEEIIELDEKEESAFLKIQFLHNTFNLRIDLTRQKREAKSLNVTWYGGTQTSPSGKNTYHIRKTHKGKKLEKHYVYHGKIYSTSIERPKSCYFQTENKLYETIKNLKGVTIDKNQDPVSFVKKYILEDYKKYIRFLMQELGSEKFEKHSVRFKEFVKWYNEHH